MVDLDIIMVLCFNILCKNIFVVLEIFLQKYFYSINYVPRFSDLEQDYMHANGQLATFMATTQLVNYSRAREIWRTL